MSVRALLYAYILGGITFIPLLILALVFYTIYTATPVNVLDADSKQSKESPPTEPVDLPSTTSAPSLSDVNDLPKVRKGWLIVRRTFEEQPSDASYVGMVRGFLDARSKDARRSRPKDMWYVVLKGKVLYLYEDESMTECEAAIELGGHDVAIFPEGLLDGELFSKRNAICLKPRISPPQKEMPSITKEMKLQSEHIDEKVEAMSGGPRQKQRERERLLETEKQREEAREQALDLSTPWFMFVRSVVEMEDWYHALVHASDHPANAPTLAPLEPVFQPADMSRLVETLDEQPDTIPMRWLNALIGRIFFSYYRTDALESYIIGRLMKKIAKVKRPGFLSDINVREVSVGNKAPTFSKPMLKELTKEGDAALELHLHYKGEVRITVEATATINLGARFKTYTVKLVLALVIKEIEGNLLMKVKRPPSSRIWYAFTQMPRIVMVVEPVVSDRQITWSMILSTIESRVKEVIQESVVLPNMDDISFFESRKYSHRGGIWADASRRETQSSYSSGTDAEDDARSTISASAAELSMPMPTDPEHPPVQRSKSAQETAFDTKASPDSSDADLHHPSATLHAVSDLSPGTRRRTWFGGQRDEDSVASGSSPPNPEEENDNSAQRGRPSETENTLSRRSSSTPINASSGVSEESTPQPSVDQKEEDDYLSPHITRRSSSQHSQSSSSRGTSGPLSSDDETPNVPADTIPSSPWRPKPPQHNSSGKSSAASSTAAFLQTLKSRAGDKQALSNTAKEAMRKWGVNWSGLRRDNGGHNNEEIPDGGQDEPQRQLGVPSHTRRPSYAEVRAAVEQRREKEAPMAQATLGAELRSDPVPIPQNDKGKERARSVSPSISNAASSLGSTPAVNPSPRQSADGDAQVHPRSVSPALLMQRTESSKSKSSADGVGTVTPDELPATPIQTQPPQARTMTIPGIHASHRGEVMSMGYAPPSPPVPQEKKPAIQSVYRLWKSPSSSPGQPPRAMESLPQTQNGFIGHDQDADAPTAETQLEVLSPRPVPPPLPPRSSSTSVLHAKAEDANAAAPPSAASTALQSIASKDKSLRASLDPVAAGAGAAGTSSERGTQNTSSASTSMPAGVPPPVPARPSPKPPALPPRRPPAAGAAAPV